MSCKTELTNILCELSWQLPKLLGCNTTSNMRINITLRRVRVTTVPVEKTVLHTLSVCLQPQLSSMQIASVTAPYYFQWPV